MANFWVPGVTRLPGTNPGRRTEPVHSPEAFLVSFPHYTVPSLQTQNILLPLLGNKPTSRLSVGLLGVGQDSSTPYEQMVDQIAFGSMCDERLY